MDRPGSKTHFQRIVQKALPSARFGAGWNTSDHHTSNMPKVIGYKGQDTAPGGMRKPHHMSHWYMVTPEIQSEATYCIPERQSCPLDTRRVPPQSRHYRADKRSVQIQQHLADSTPKGAFNLDNFIQENENWTPPSPGDVAARKLFREARKASYTKSQNSQSNDYLVHRRMKSEPPVPRRNGSLQFTSKPLPEAKIFD